MGLIETVLGSVFYSFIFFCFFVFFSAILCSVFVFRIVVLENVQSDGINCQILSMGGQILQLFFYKYWPARHSRPKPNWERNSYCVDYHKLDSGASLTVCCSFSKFHSKTQIFLSSTSGKFLFIFYVSPSTSQFSCIRMDQRLLKQGNRFTEFPVVENE